MVKNYSYSIWVIRLSLVVMRIESCVSENDLWFSKKWSHTAHIICRMGGGGGCYTYVIRPLFSRITSKTTVDNIMR